MKNILKSENCFLHCQVAKIKMQSPTWRWTIGILYIIAVALIWIAASFVVQSVVDGGVSPFLITYICNSLFVVYIPIVEIGRCLESSAWKFWSQCTEEHRQRKAIQLKSRASENTSLLQSDALNQGDGACPDGSCSMLKVHQTIVQPEAIHNSEAEPVEVEPLVKGTSMLSNENVDPDTLEHIHKPRRWTRTETAKISLLICPFWFLAQLTFNLSLKYTTVTSNTILSSTSSLFTFLVSLAILDEKFSWVKLLSVLLCMVGTIVVSLGDSETGKNEIATNPLLGDFLCLVSAMFYALYTTLIRKKIPDEEKGEGQVSTALFLGFLGLFNALIFLPPVLILHFTRVEPFHGLTLMQFGLIVGKGLLDNVLSDYLWAKAVLLTTPTVATAGLSIQVPLAALVDSLRGNLPHLLDYIGGAAVLAGFFGINEPVTCCASAEDKEETGDHHDSQHNTKQDTGIDGC
uniref:EamA domain-containing protein n=1 Tax=Araucaria cunninghamii TaxID=56994 RepID=A0A0D6QUB4_ARACU